MWTQIPVDFLMTPAMVAAADRDPVAPLVALAAVLQAQVGITEIPRYLLLAIVRGSTDAAIDALIAEGLLDEVDPHSVAVPADGELTRMEQTRSEQASKAAQARWAKEKEEDTEADGEDEPEPPATPPTDDAEQCIALLSIAEQCDAMPSTAEHSNAMPKERKKERKKSLPRARAREADLEDAETTNSEDAKRMHKECIIDANECIKNANECIIDAKSDLDKTTGRENGVISMETRNRTCKTDAYYAPKERKRERKKEILTRAGARETDQENASVREEAVPDMPTHATACASMRPHAPACASMRPHAPACTRMRPHANECLKKERKKEKKKDSSARTRAREELHEPIEELTGGLAQALAAHGVTAQPSRAWDRAWQRLLARHGPESLHQVIAFIATDRFWATTAISPAMIERHYAQLAAKAQAAQATTDTGTTGPVSEGQQRIRDAGPPPIPEAIQGDAIASAAWAQEWANRVARGHPPEQAAEAASRALDLPPATLTHIDHYRKEASCG